MLSCCAAVGVDSCNCTGCCFPCLAPWRWAVNAGIVLAAVNAAVSKCSSQYTVNCLCNDCFGNQEVCPYIKLSLFRGTTAVSIQWSVTNGVVLTSSVLTKRISCCRNRSVVTALRSVPQLMTVLIQIERTCCRNKSVVTALSSVPQLMTVLTQIEHEYWNPSIILQQQTTQKFLRRLCFHAGIIWSAPPREH